MFNQKLIKILVKFMAIALWILFALGTIWAFSLSVDNNYNSFDVATYFIGAELVVVLYFALAYLITACFNKYLVEKK